MSRWIVLVLALGACSAPEHASTPPPSQIPAPVTAVPGDAMTPAVAEVGVDVPVEQEALDAGPAAADHLELTFMGDIIFGGLFNGKWSPEDVEANDPLTEVAPMIASDLALANLETTVVDDIPELTGDKRFAATPAQVALLPKNGIGFVTVANNHVNDLDGPGVAETPGHLADLGINAIGVPRAEEPVFRVETFDVKGWKIGFIAATTKLNRRQKKGAPRVPFCANPDDLKDLLVPVIEAARADHDLVILVLHWGVQYDDEPSPWQVEAAHAFIDAGADAVIGHHPHVLQGIERYKNGIIAYSLGNFVFQNGEFPARDAGILRIGFSRADRCLDLAAFHPTVLKRQPVHHPIKPVGAEFKEVQKRLVSESKDLDTDWTVDGDRLVTQAACGVAD